MQPIEKSNGGNGNFTVEQIHFEQTIKMKVSALLW